MLVAAGIMRGREWRALVVRAEGCVERALIRAEARDRRRRKGQQDHLQRERIGDDAARKLPPHAPLPKALHALFSAPIVPRATNRRQSLHTVASGKFPARVFAATATSLRGTQCRSNPGATRTALDCFVGLRPPRN